MSDRRVLYERHLRGTFKKSRPCGEGTKYGNGETIDTKGGHSITAGKASTTQFDIANKEPVSATKTTADVISLQADILERGAMQGAKLAAGAGAAAALGSQEASQLSGLANQASAFGKVMKVTGAVGSAVSTGIAVSEVVDQYKKGGVGNVLQNRSIVDAGVGAVGLAGTALATLGIISNPVGWGIGIATLAYSVGTLVYDSIKK